MFISFTLQQLGWLSFYQQQVSVGENQQLIFAHIKSQHRYLITAQRIDQEIFLGIVTK